MTSKWIQFEEEAMEVNGLPPYQPTIVIESDSEEEEEKTSTINWTEEEESRMTVAELNERLDHWEAKIVELKEYLVRKDPREEILGEQEEILQEIMETLEDPKEKISSNPTEYLANLCIIIIDETEIKIVEMVEMVEMVEIISTLTF